MSWAMHDNRTWFLLRRGFVEMRCDDAGTWYKRDDVVVQNFQNNWSLFKMLKSKPSTYRCVAGGEGLIDLYLALVKKDIGIFHNSWDLTFDEDGFPIFANT